MKTTYVKELEYKSELLGRFIIKCPNILQNMTVFLRRLFRISRVIPMKNNKKLKILPYSMEELEKKQRWYQKQIEKEEAVILSKNLFQNKKLELEQYSCRLWDGKKLFSHLVIPTLHYICERMEKNIEESNVAIVLLKATEENIQIICELARTVKHLSVVTPNIQNFRNVEKRLYNEDGIAMKLSNNKKRGLKQETTIINLDLSQNELWQYEINKKAVLIHVKETIKELPKGFRGISINQLEITTNRDNRLPQFFESHQYEAETEQYFALPSIEQKLKEDEVKIKYLIGKRGRIAQQEYGKLKNF